MRQLLGLCTLLCVIVWAQSQCVPASLSSDPILDQVGDISKIRVPVQPLLTQYSQLATIFKPAPLTITDQSNCPHKWADLVHWHDAATWTSGSVPAAGSNVVLPDNTKVLISHCSWPTAGYGTITIPATSTLVVNDYNMDLTFRNMYVAGKFYMGSPTCRLFANITVHFTGGKSLNNEIGPNMGAKGIGVSASGLIEVHGKQYHPTWTRLAAIANVGDDVLFLDDEVNWEPYQEIVITTTVYDDLEQFNTRKIHQNEVRTIIGVVGRKVYLNESLSFQHYAGQEYQAEVGLLTRRIRFMGHPDENSFGGHIIVVGEGRFSGAQGYEMGQLNQMARYPFHFHLGGEKPNNYVQDCAIYNSQFRCVTIHGTNSTKVTRNVAYNIAGSCFYIEDGVEEKNEVSFNLAAHARPIGTPSAGSDSQQGQTFTNDAITMHPSDHSAACFYTTNAYNSIVGNAASGGWTGFSFPNLFYVFGPSAVVFPSLANLVPSSRPTLRFEGNSAHSAGKVWASGSCFYVGGMFNETGDVATYNSGRSKTRNPQYNGQNAWMHWKNLRAWLCNKAINHWGERVIIESLEVHDSSRGAVLFGESVISHALFNADSGNVANHDAWQTDAFSYYDTAVRIVLNDITFRNFNTSRAVAIRATTPFDVFKPEGIASINKVRFENTPITNRIDPALRDLGSSRYFNILDADGSFSGTGTKTLLGSSMTDPTTSSRWWDFCNQNKVVDPTWSMYACSLPTDSTKDVAYIYIVVPGLAEDTRNNGNNDPANNARIGKMFYWGTGRSEELSTPLTKNPGVAGLTGVGGWFYDLGANMKNNFKIRTQTMPKYASIMFATGFPSGTTFTIYQGTNPTTGAYKAAASYLDLFNSVDGKQYFFDGQYLYMKLVSQLTKDSYFGYAGVRLTDQVGWSGYDISVTATCPNGNCVTNALPPTITPVNPPILTSLILKGDTVFPRADPPEFRDPYQSFAGATVASSTALPANWGWTALANFPSVAPVTSDWISGGACAGSPIGAVQTCGTENSILRQPCPQGTLVWSKTVSTQVLKYRASFRYGYLDAWGWNQAWAKINGVQVWSRMYGVDQTTGTQLCGSLGMPTGKPYYNDFFETLTIPETLFLGNTITVEFGALINGTLNDRSFAISKFVLEVLTMQNASLPVTDCKWGLWTGWAPSSCPNNCSVTQTRSRVVASQASNGGVSCSGPSTFTQYCPCVPVACVWNDWSAFSNCSACVKTRTRTIKSVALNGGDPCPGLTTDSQVCPGCGACGNNIVEGSEQCDDGNLVAGDGCTSNCSSEYGYKCPTIGGACSKLAVPTSSSIDRVTTSLPMVIPVKGSISLNVAYGASVDCVIIVAIFNPSWAYYSQANYGVKAGVGIARLTISNTKTITDPLVMYQVTLQSYADYVAGASTKFDQYTVTGVVPSASITNTNGASLSTTFVPQTGLTTYSLDPASFPTRINKNSPTEFSIAYTAATDSTLVANVQIRGSPYTWYTKALAAVPAGTGVVKMSILPKTALPDGVSISYTLGGDATLAAGQANQFSVWSAAPVTSSASAAAIQDSSSTFSGSDSSSPFSVDFFVGGIAIGMAVVVVGAVAWKVFERKYYYSD